MEQYRAEIRNTERAFAELAQNQGLKVAFLTYAADDAILKRGGRLIRGKEAIGHYFEQEIFHNARLQWEPDFVGVSASGDLGYTYGQFDFETTDENGEVIKNSGIFHTVWRKQQDGEWRYVWD